MDDPKNKTEPMDVAKPVFFASMNSDVQASRGRFPGGIAGCPWNHLELRCAGCWMANSVKSLDSCLAINSEDRCIDAHM